MTAAATGPALAGIPLEFLIFAATLVGVALAHRRAFTIAVAGLAVLLVLVLASAGPAAGLLRLAVHFSHEWVILANLLLLLLGFAVLANQFELSNAPEAAPRILPDGWLGGFVLLVLVAVLSSFLDNIAGAMIGGVVARHVYRGQVGVGFLAAIVAASNAGGAGSVVGDTTTTMIWLSGVSPLLVADAFIGAAVAILVFGIPAALRQHRTNPIVKHAVQDIAVDWVRVGLAGVMLATILLTNLVGNILYPEMEEVFPALGAALWVAIGATSLVRRPDWRVLRGSVKGALFLIALVASASLMPVKALPAPSWMTTLGLGFISAVFDNIPLTALALNQGGYDWGLLAYAVGFGGSMLWFGSSAGVALSALYPEARSVRTWVTQGWAIPIAYVAGFLVMLAVLGWRPTG
jgi:Na+/H+ antiporter NhaD/arsenite permease-like protein